MGIVLIMLFIVLGITGLTYLINKGDRDEWECTGAGAIISGFLLGILLSGILSVSYVSYVDIRTKYDATISQYREAITMYKDSASIDVEKAALTDLKYQGYQENIAEFIKDLRRQVTRYNEELISKRIMDKNFMFNWVIIAPDKDMKILRLIE